nr:MAG TPA: hypothetical protein [Caudoviricetes sp.]
MVTRILEKIQNRKSTLLIYQRFYYIYYIYILFY